MKIKWQKLPFGFLIEDNRLRMTAWDCKLGIVHTKTKRHTKVKYLRYGFRFVEWPWNGWAAQIYWQGRVIRQKEHWYRH